MFTVRILLYISRHTPTVGRITDGLLVCLVVCGPAGGGMIQCQTTRSHKAQAGEVVVFSMVVSLILINVSVIKKQVEAVQSGL